jgi:DNA-binding Lrp family transcriptional regulator
MMDFEAVVLGWLAGVGAAGLAEIADLAGVSEPSAAARLRALARDGLVRQLRLLAAEPALWAITAGGLRAAGRPDLTPARVSPSGFLHILECARTARALERTAGGAYSVHSERELRSWERAGQLVASAELGYGSQPDRHRPDLVLLRRRELPIAIEVELTVKGPARLRAIVRAWARSRRVSLVIYYASDPAARALERAVELERAATRVRVLRLCDRSKSPIPSAP